MPQAGSQARFSKSFMASSPVGLRRMRFSRASLFYFLDLLQRNRIGAATPVHVSGDLYKFAHEWQKLLAYIDTFPSKTWFPISRAQWTVFICPVPRLYNTVKRPMFSVAAN
jgi:hypothetical protein